jgi:hypothetical protein
MPADDQAAREARAKQLRREIDKIKSSANDAENEAGKKAVGPRESPREFIERRMRELDKDGPTDESKK